MSQIDPNDLHRNPESLRGTRLFVDEPAEWVVRRKVKNAARLEGHPVTLLLLDRQICPDKLARYTRHVRRLETPQAVQDAGRVELDFDPATQSLHIHAVSIFRNGELTNLAKLDEVQVIQRERDLDNGIYAGSITALLLLKDVRTGDVIDVETSIVSDDAIFPDQYWFQENFEHIQPVVRQYFSWLSNQHDRYQIRQTAEEITLNEEATTWGIRKTWSAETTKVIDLEPFLPIGLNPFRHIALTSFDSWNQVASEIAQLWDTRDEPSDALLEELTGLRTAHSESEVETIEACVAFVRDNIRYQGVEIGRLGLVPEKLSEVWERRYGDCKEKTSLLCWLLRGCGFDATPALVSTTLRSYVSDELPAPVFDHVLVYLEYDGTDYWIDPTNIAQRGSLESWTTVPYGKALLISQDTQGFTQISDPPAGRDILRVTEDYHFSSGTSAVISVRHEYLGAQADEVRHVLDSAGRNAVRQIFLDIVKSTRSQAEMETDIEILDDAVANRLTMEAKFKAADVLKRDSQRGVYVCEFIPHSIIGKIVGIDDKPREHPLGLVHPVEVEHVTRIDHPDAKGAVVPKTIIDNEYISFKAGTRNELKNPELFYQLRTKASEVPVNDLIRYKVNLEQMSGALSLFFECQHLAGADNRNRAKASSRPRWDEGEYDTRPQPRHYAGRDYQAGTQVPVALICIGVFVVLKIIFLIISSSG